MGVYDDIYCLLFTYIFKNEPNASFKRLEIISFSCKNDSFGMVIRIPKKGVLLRKLLPNVQQKEMTDILLGILTKQMKNWNVYDIMELSIP